jgi:hypothetical protein
MDARRMQRSPRRPLTALALSLALTACGSGGGGHAATTPSEGWLDVAGMRCADGTGTGLWLSRGTSPDLLLVLSGGGACWSADRCPGDVPSQFGKAEWDLLQLFHLMDGSIADRTMAQNPFRAWNLVFIPYCTGDVHAGDAVNDYVGIVPTTWRQGGFANLEAAVARVRAEVPAPGRIVVSGFSAGGFGALVAHDLVHAAYGPGPEYTLLDDSGPTFVGTAQMPGQLLADWWDAWNLASTLGATCPGCSADLSQAWDGLHARHPSDRLALLSTTQDSTMRGFFADPVNATTMDPMVFQTGLGALCDKLAGLGGHTAACFRVAGAQHTMILGPASFSAGGTEPLWGWLTKLVTDDPAWGPAGP